MKRYIRRFLITLSLPYFRIEAPGWRRLSSVIGLPIGSEGIWAASSRIIRGKSHGYLMSLNLEDWCERLTYFLGRYYEIGIQLFVKAALRRGDSFVDVGGNIGMVTLIAASSVGGQGRIYTFEPNPDLVERIRTNLAINDLRNITLHPVGLSDINSKLTFTVTRESNGWGTFGDVERADNLTYKVITVPVRRGDDILPKDVTGPTVIKIDAEGFECHVLRGMTKLLSRLHPAVVTEVEPLILERAGSSVLELFETMREHGYQAYGLETKRFITHRLLLRRLDHLSQPLTNNIVWIHPLSIHLQRLEKYILD